LPYKIEPVDKGLVERAIGKTTVEIFAGYAGCLIFGARCLTSPIDTLGIEVERGMEVVAGNRHGRVSMHGTAEVDRFSVARVNYGPVERDLLLALVGCECVEAEDCRRKDQ